MALKLIEGFEGYNDVEEFEIMRGYNLSSTYNGFQFTTGRNNGKCFRREKDHGYAGAVYSYFPFENTDATVILGFALKIDYPSNYTEAGIFWGSVQQASFKQNGNILRMYERHSTSQPAVVAEYTFSYGEWLYCEIKHYLNNTVGFMEFRINEQVIGRYDGDTAYNSSYYFTNFTFSCDEDAQAHIDDLYICNGEGSEFNNYLGDIRIDAVFPNGAGTHTDLTPLSGNNYENIDEVVFDGSDYNYSANVGDKDSYTYEDVPTDLDDAAIYAVALNSSCKRTVAANNIQLKNIVRQGGADYSQTARSVSDDFTTKQDIIIKDPSDSNPWTKAKINSAEFGVEVG